MEEIHGKVYSNVRVDLDNRKFKNCKFNRCTLVYSGGGPIALEDCEVVAPSYVFEGSAENTVKFMTLMYHRMDGGKLLIEQTFNNIRRNNPFNPNLSSDAVH